MPSCRYSYLRKFSARQGFESCDNLVEKVDALALGYNQVAVARQYVEEGLATREGCKRFEYVARKDAETAADWCDLARAVESRKKAEQCPQQVQKCSQNAIDDQGENEKISKKKLELQKLILEQNYETQRRELDALVDAEEENKIILVEEMDQQITLMRQQLKLTGTSSTKLNS